MHMRDGLAGLEEQVADPQGNPFQMRLEQGEVLLAKLRDDDVGRASLLDVVRARLLNWGRERDDSLGRSRPEDVRAIS
jgi:hypothetical protein